VTGFTKIRKKNKKRLSDVEMTASSKRSCSMLMPLYLVSAPFTVSSAPLTGSTGRNQDTYEKNHCNQEHDFFHIFEG
jgi:hypothetical protein